MNIIVCVKCISTNLITLEKKTSNFSNKRNLNCYINPYDLYAVEEALRIKDNLKDTTVTVISMGPFSGSELLEQLYYIGVDEVILLSDKYFAGADTLATGYTLHKAIERLGAYDLIICGQMSIDGDTGQVAPMLGSKLRIPFISNIIQLLEVSESSIICKRKTDYDIQIVKVELPMVVSVQRRINEPRTPTLRAYAKYKNKRITVWSQADIDADIKKCGQLGSATQVLKVHKIDQVNHCEYMEGQGEQAIDMLVQKLIEEGRMI